MMRRYEIKYCGRSFISEWQPCLKKVMEWDAEKQGGHADTRLQPDSLVPVFFWGKDGRLSDFLPLPLEPYGNHYSVHKGKDYCWSWWESEVCSSVSRCCWMASSACRWTAFSWLMTRCSRVAMASLERWFSKMLSSRAKEELLTECSIRRMRYRRA